MADMQTHERLIVAVDSSERSEILELVRELSGTVGMFKIGLQAFIANGPSIVREVRDCGEKVFLDLKLHDIPNTVAHAAREAAILGASLLTVHASGGVEMMRAAKTAVTVSSNPELSVVAVTVLTSLADSDLNSIGFAASTRDSVQRLALLAREAGLDGVVASPLEVESVRKVCGSDFLIVTPGIRSSRDEVGDQKRTMSASEAVAAGASYIVVGRPITGAANRRAAAEMVVEEMAGG